MSSATPKHIAFIMDGNGRWAEKQGLQRLMGHKKGADVVKSTVQMCAEHGVEYVTFFAFSMENWKRSKEEVNGLMELLRQFSYRIFQHNGKKYSYAFYR